jgi:type III restriction enzyme
MPDAANLFFDHPILNSPYEQPRRHWELDSSGQPTQKIVQRRRRAEFITPIPKPKKRKRVAQQDEMVFDEGKGISTKGQMYDIETDYAAKVQANFGELIERITTHLEPAGK